MNNKEESSRHEAEELHALLAQYEKMLATGESVYFDSSDLADIAEQYTATEQYTKALEALDYGLQLHPDNVDLLTMKASVFLDKGDVCQARQLIDSLPEYSDYNLAILKASLAICEKDFQEAETILASIEKQTGPSTDFYIDAAYIYCDGENPEKAIEWFEKAFEQHIPKDLDALQEYAQCCFVCQKYDKLITYYQTYVDNDPYNATGWYGLSRTYMECGEPEKALENIEFVLAIDPDNEAAILLKATAYFQLGNYETSLALYKNLHQQFPENVQYLFLLGLAHYNLNKYEEAVYFLETANKLYSDSGDISFETDLLYTLAIAYKYNNQLESAIQTVNKLITSSTQADTNIYLLKGELELDNHNLSVADEFFHKALAQDDFKQAETYLRILSAFEIQKQTMHGITFMEQIRKQYPDNPLPSLCLAHSYFQIGDNEKAQFYTEQAISINADSLLEFKKAQHQFITDIN